MKKLSIIFAAALAVFASCQKESPTATKKGVELTISTTIAKPVTKTSYEYTAHQGEGTGAGTIAVSWEATEHITVVSIGESGITAVDDFISTGEAGREKAEFTGTWKGNEGDKVICLYPPISSGRFSGVEKESTSITINFVNPAPSTNINSLKNYDIMIGNVTISGATAHVTLKRQISVLKFGVSGGFFPYDYEIGAKLLVNMGFSARTSGGVAKLFVSNASLAATKSTYTGIMSINSYMTNNKPSIASQTSSYETYYLPILVDGSLENGDKLRIDYSTKERDPGDPYYTYSFNCEKTITSSLSFEPGYVYAINGISL